MCMLLRMAGRFSCYALQNVWTTDMKETLEALAYDSNESVRNVSFICVLVGNFPVLLCVINYFKFS